MTAFKDFIKFNSIDNLRLGKITSRVGQWYGVRVGFATLTLRFTGEASVGDVVTLECPDGDLNKGHIVETSPLVLGDGGIIEV
jgi:hypothetical protein